MNTGLEGQAIEEGMILTFQLIVWFSLFIGILAAWKPERFDHAKRRIGAAIGLDNDEEEAS